LINTSNEIIYQLTKKYCNALLLRDTQEMSTKEMAELLAISAAYVKLNYTEHDTFKSNFRTNDKIVYKTGG
jgi:cytoplasmic iron level regulating protein YaaA (DUF328/UPF0246 family)